MSAAIFLEKAHEALQVAQLALEQRCPNSAANRAYYAAYHATRAALVDAHVSGANEKWGHEAIQARISRLTREGKRGLPSRLGAELARLRMIRDIADYEQRMVSLRQARDVVKTATEFVSAVANVIQP